MELYHNFLCLRREKCIFCRKDSVKMTGQILGKGAEGRKFIKMLIFKHFMVEIILELEYNVPRTKMCG